MAPDPLRWTRRSVIVLWLAWVGTYAIEPIRIHVVATYGEKHDAMPVLRSVRKTSSSAKRTSTYITDIDKLEFGAVADVPPLVGHPSVPEPPSGDHVLARVMRGLLWAAAGTVAMLLSLIGMLSAPRDGRENA